MEPKKADLLNDFNTLIDSVPKSKDKELLEMFRTFNKNFDKHDKHFLNFFQGIGIFFSKNIKIKCKKYVEDILDKYDTKYGKNEKEMIMTFLKGLVEKYSERTLWDKILSVLGHS